VYTVRHDEQQETAILFGDGVHGARLPSRVRNVIANYLFGAGEAAPPAGSIKQVMGAVKGIKRVRQPVAASKGCSAASPSYGFSLQQRTKAYPLDSQ
jgi:hypothetical protein